MRHVIVVKCGMRINSPASSLALLLGSDGERYYQSEPDW